MTDNSGSKWTEEVQETVLQEGGGDYFGLVNMGWGFKFFKSQVENEKLWFPYNKQDKTGQSKQAALALANRAIVEHGLEVKKIETHFCMWINTSQMFGRDTSKWQTQSMWWALKVWDPNMAEIVIPHMEKLGVSAYTTQVWGKISQAADVGGYMKDGIDKETGKPIKIAKKVGYLAEVYPDEASCRAAAAKASGESTPASAEQSLDDEIREVHQQDMTMSLFAIAQIYGKNVKELAAILGYSQQQVTDDVKLLKGKDAPAGEVATFYGIPVKAVERLWA